MEDQVRESSSVINAGPDVDPMIEDGPSSTVLDLDSFQLHDIDSVELPQSLTELELTVNRVSNLDTRIGNLSLLKKLSLHQNLISDAAVELIYSSHALSAIEELVLRDNKLTKIPDISIFKQFTVFDVSYNQNYCFIWIVEGLQYSQGTLCV